MNMLAINLLPVEIEAVKKENAKKAKLIKLSTLSLVVSFIATLGVFVFTLSQNLTLSETKKGNDQAILTINNLKTKEKLILSLKNRVALISSHLNTESPDVISYNLIEKLLIPGISLQSLRTEEGPKLQLSGGSSSTTSLQLFFENLTDPEKNQGLITAVDLNSLNVGSSGLIRFELTIKLASITSKKN